MDWFDLEHRNLDLGPCRQWFREREKRIFDNVRRLQMGEDIERTWEEERRRDRRWSNYSLEVELAELENELAI